jgi:CRISPR-associated exonuclease Cas4
MKLMSTYRINVSALRQFVFCPRIFYFENILGIKTTKPYWTKQGTLGHKKETELFKRRTLSRFRLENAEKRYQVFLEDEEFALHGIADMLILNEKQVYPVEFKATDQVLDNILIQLHAYGWLAERQYGKIVKGGFLVSTDKKKTIPVKFKENWREQLETKLKTIRSLLEKQVMPTSNATIHKCEQCEYWQRCNDRY